MPLSAIKALIFGDKMPPFGDIMPLYSYLKGYNATISRRYNTQIGVLYSKMEVLYRRYIGRYVNKYLFVSLKAPYLDDENKM